MSRIFFFVVLAGLVAIAGGVLMLGSFPPSPQPHAGNPAQPTPWRYSSTSTRVPTAERLRAWQGALGYTKGGHAWTQADVERLERDLPTCFLAFWILGVEEVVRHLCTDAHATVLPDIEHPRLLLQRRSGQRISIEGHNLHHAPRTQR